MKSVDNNATITAFLCESRRSPGMTDEQMITGWRALGGIWCGLGGISIGVTRCVRLRSGEARYDIAGVSAYEDADDVVANRCRCFFEHVKRVCGG